MFSKNFTKDKLRKGQPAFGFRMEFASPYIVELMGNLGFDFVYFDCEHGPMSEGDCEDMIRAAELAGITPMARVSSNQPNYILRQLDLGAMGIIVPHCSSRETAEMAVKAAKYPPDGDRGIAGRLWTLGKMTTPDYIKWANEETLIVAMIEDEEGVENIEEIAAVDGLDVLWIGRADLSVSMGIPGQRDHASLKAAVDKVITTARDLKKIVGIGWVDFDDPESIKGFINKGAQFFSLGTTGVLMKAAGNLLKEIKKQEF